MESCISKNVNNSIATKLRMSLLKNPRFLNIFSAPHNSMTKLCRVQLKYEINWKLVEKINAQFWSALKWERVSKKWMSWAGISLNTKYRISFLNLLRKFEDLFNRTLGTWNTTLVDLESRYDAKPLCLRNDPVTRVHKVMFRKEVEIIVSLGVFEEENDSDWGAPSFAQPKAKTNRVIFLSDFSELK